MSCINIWREINKEKEIKRNKESEKENIEMH